MSVVSPLAAPAALATNQAPVVQAGEDLKAASTHALLDATVTLNSGKAGALTTAWSKISGPGEVTFEDASAIDTAADFSTSGTYVLQLTASQGTLTASDQITVTVPVPNKAPVVEAGVNQSVLLSAALALAGTVSDDGLPNGSQGVTTTWTAVSGPGEVTFGNASSANTTASFSKVGTYVLRLTANDGELTTSDDVTITVNAAGDPQATSTYLSDLPFVGTPTNGWGPVERNMSNGEAAAGDGKPITINGVRYNKGLGVHANSEVTFDLAGKYNRFVSSVGVDDEETSNGSVIFQVWGDGTKLYDSGLMTVDSAARAVDVSVAGVRQLKLVVTNGGNGVTSDHADWADARLVAAPVTSETSTYLSDLPFAGTPTNGWGPVERNMSNGEAAAGDGKPITINGVRYNKGLGVHANSAVTFDLAGKYNRFVSSVGVDDEETSNGSVTFQVWGDGTKLYDSGLMTVDSAARAVDVSVAGVRQLKLVVTDGGNGMTSDHADWADARLMGVGSGQNVAPLVNAGPDRSVAVSAALALDGTVSDDGQPNPPGATATTWTKVSGPGTVIFADAKAVDTTAQFGAAGSYVLKLEANDGQYTASDLVNVTVTTSTPQAVTGFFVSPTGSASGDGSAARPWDLKTALAQPSAVKPGDTIWLRGGTYRGNFTSNLTGTKDKPITVRAYPGEDVVIDLNHGSNFYVQGGYTNYWGFEVTNSDPGTRISSQTGTLPSDISQGTFFNYGNQNKFINLVVHDLVASGIGFWAAGEGGEIYGSIIYNNGWLGTDRGHGHGIYTQNLNGTKYITDNIIFNNFGEGIQAYSGADNNKLTGFNIEGNAIFNTGAGAGVGFNAQRNILVGGDTPAKDITLSNNYTYQDGSKAGIVALGYTAESNKNVTLTGNYIVGELDFLKPWESITASGNTVVGSVTGDAPGSGISVVSRPNQDAVFVRPNEYESGRGNVIAYNWDGNASVNVDLSSVLTVGATYEIHHVYDLSGQPVATGVYKGGTIQVPMKATTAPRPTNYTKANPITTGPNFGVFVVTTTSATPKPLVAADGAVQGSASGERLTQAGLAEVVDDAMAQWRATGLTNAQLAALAQVRFQVADLDGARLGEAAKDAITLDVDAAGHGWFIDPTPQDSTEYQVNAQQSLVARQDGPAANRMDLLTVVMHEMGHILGRDHANEDGDLMSETLETGIRHGLDADALDLLFKSES